MAADESGDIVWQFGRPGRFGGGDDLVELGELDRRRSVEFESGVAGQDLLMQFLQGWSGFDTMLLAQVAVRVDESGEGVGLPTRSVQGQHQQSAHTFPSGM